MQLLAVLGQYLLLAFVLPGFCYLFVFALCFPELLHGIRTGLPIEHKANDGKAGNGKSNGQDSSLGFGMLFLIMTGGLLLSSTAFAIEIILRNTIECFNCKLFRDIPFESIKHNDLANFFAGETFMHFNIGVGLLIVVVIYLIWNRWPELFKYSSKKPRPQLKGWLVVMLLILGAANLLVASHLFDRVADVAFENAPDKKKTWQEGCSNRHKKKAWL